MLTPIPQPPGVPVLGNIFDVNPNNTWASLKGLAEKYGEIFQIKVLGHPIVFVASSALAEELCDQKRFRKYVGGPIKEIRYAVHDSLFTAYEDEASWGIAHRIIAPHLSPAAVRGGEGEMNDIVDELFAKWARLNNDNSNGKSDGGSSGSSNTVQLVGELNRLNLETTTYTLYGHKLNQLDTPAEHPMLKAMEDSTSEAMKRPTRLSLVNWLVYGGKLKKSTKVMRDYAAEIVAHRRKNEQEGTTTAATHNSRRKDLLDALLTAKDPETGLGFTPSQVIDEIVTMPIGSSTAPCLLAAAVYFLLQNPQVVTKARAELDRVTGSGGSGSGSGSAAAATTPGFTLEQLDQLTYTAGVLREALRLSCAAPGFNIEPIPRADKKDKSPVLLAGGKYAVAHNQAMIIVLAGVNRDPAVFDEPLEFRPERMVGEQFDALPQGVKKWFGNGKRECIGKHWAWQFSLIALARMIRDVDFEAADPGYEFRQDGWFNIRPVDFYVKVKPRKGGL
ncbi:cytochrome P450 [Microdochium trichocladiopsis]|uniref:Cytochrome P450 n=1 Tax=Microdochium trichocladiopsis TaxID=1682393 RepID=A0A9P8Y7E6_9PEZI|nr:cytochrome P450 [Microdochium trichocladiopsis]KAH7029526.1 cytochrome P450 [Microdochium trichocladiopsis]